MIKCEATKTFTLKRFGELQNLIRKNETKADEGKVYKEDIFECNEDLAKYLMGENGKKETVAKILEVIPEKVEEVGDVIISEKPKKNKRKKKA